jgi:rSAM/selenodomain-associated transferase 1
LNRIVVYGREPVPDRVKTRLARSLGGEGAARVYDAVLRHTLREAERCSGEVILALAEPPSEEFARRTEIPIEVQRGANLGSRMAETFERQMSRGASRVVIVGSDCPAVTAGHLDGAFAALQRDRVVLGPAIDGGYWLVGQRTPGADLFTGIPWSSRDTLEATRSRLRELEIRWSELEELGDVDTAEDLDRELTSRQMPVRLQEELEGLLNTLGGIP